MLSIAVYSPQPGERALLEQVFRDSLAQWSSEDAAIHCYSQLTQVEQALRSADPADVICLDITGADGIPAAERIRSGNGRMLLVLIADEQMSPRMYMRPSIMAASILFRPLRREEARAILQEVLQVWEERNADPSEQFVFSASGETHRIPHSEILYFEAREKRIFLRTSHSEYGFYETMEHLSGILPACFLRCHKSYIVNMTYLRSLNLAQNCLQLGDSAITVPVSRTYKPALKAWREGLA